MAALTTDIFTVPTAGQAGFIAASNTPTVKFCRVTDAAVNAALAVCDGATPGQTCKVPTTAAEAKACIGILVNPEFLNDSSAATDYLITQQATILEEGFIWVNAEGTVAFGDPVYVRHTSDGGSNLTRGTMRNNSNGTLVIDTTSTVEGVYRVTLFNGVVNETFSYQTDGTASANEITTGLVAAIDASANYSAAGTTECTVTLVAGSEISIVALAGPTAAAEALYTVTDNQKAARLKGARFASAVTGAGLAQVRLHNISRD